MNSSSINWRKFTLQLSSAVIQKIEPLTNEKRRNVLIIDDSLFSRARAKKVELLAKVYDHVEHNMITEKWLFLEKELNAMLDSFLENLPDLWHNYLNRCA